MRLFFRSGIVRLGILLLSSYLLIAYLLYAYLYEIIKNIDGILQIIGESLGVIIGLFLTFYYNNTQERISFANNLKRIFYRINAELNYNIEVLDLSFTNRQDYIKNIKLLKTTVWDIYKEGLNRAPFDWVDQLSRIYYQIQLLNKEMVGKDIKTDEFKRFKEIADTIIVESKKWQSESREDITKIYLRIQR